MVEDICISRERYLAKADEAELHSESPDWHRPLEIDAHTFAYYLPVRDNGEDLWAVALESEQQGDGLLTESGRVLLFSNAPVGHEVWAGYGLSSDPDFLDVTQRRVDLDSVRAWLADPRPEHLDYNLLMNAWQFFESLTPSGRRHDWLASAAYQHLWIGIYAPGVEVSIPDWRRDELATLRNFMDMGLKAFEKIRRKVV